MAERWLEVALMAQADITRIAEFYEETAGPLISRQAFETIDKAIDRIAEGIVTHRPGKRGTRECVLRKFPYIVIYRIYPTKIRVVRVLHQARDYFST
jgi:plasmid stabilization system protein ParE